MFQGMFVVSSLVLSVAAIGGTLAAAGNPVAPGVLKVWREPPGWTTPALGARKSTADGRVAFRDGTSTRVSRTTIAPDEGRLLLVALADGNAR